MAKAMLPRPMVLILTQCDTVDQLQCNVQHVDFAVYRYGAHIIMGRIVSPVRYAGSSKKLLKVLTLFAMVCLQLYPPHLP